MIRFKNVNKIYKNGDIDYKVLKNISFEIHKGEYVLITGKSGSGKSTLLNILNGVDTLSSGEVIVNGNNITRLNESQMSIWRGKNIGIIFQFFQLIPNISVIENILLPMDLIGTVPEKNRETKAMELLQTVGLSKHANKMPSSLSGGEQQRVAIARALANDVDIIVADEPTGNLDSINSKIIFDLFEKLNSSGKTIVMVSHEKEIMKGITRHIILQDGNIIKDYNIEEA